MRERHVRGRGVIVLGGEDLLARFQLEPAVEQAETHRGAVGHGQIVSLATHVGRRGVARSCLAPADVLFDVEGGVLVEPAAVRLDRRAHRRRVGRHQELRHLDPRVV